MKKKILAVLTCAALALSLTACASRNDEDPVRSDKSSKENSTSSVESEPGDSNDNSDTESSNSDSGSSDSKTDDKDNSSSDNSTSKPSKPASKKVNWDDVPEVDEMDLDYIVFESKNINTNNFGSWLKDEAKEMLSDGCVIITKYFGEAENIKLPDAIDGKSRIFISTGVNWGENAKAIKFSESYSTAIGGLQVKNDGDRSYKNYNVGTGSAANVTSVEIPDSWKYIGGFSALPNLEEIKLPSETRQIYPSAFSGCQELEKITIPENVECIYEYAFQHCTSLETVNFPKKFENDCAIAPYAFSNCTSLKSVVIPEGVVMSWTNTYDRNQVSGSVFYGCTSLEKASVPSTVKTIGERTFYDCTSLKEVTIASGVERIEQSAFYNCTSLKTIDIPDSVTYITSGAFSGCTDIAINYKGKTYNEKNVEKLYNRDLSTM